MSPDLVMASAVVMRNEGDLDGKQVVVRSIEIFSVNAEGQLIRIRSFFDQPTDFALSQYFTPERGD